MSQRASLRRPPTDGPPELVLEVGPARVRVSPAAGGRVSSFELDGHELLLTSGTDAIRWGSFPMVPFAGRVREGRFPFAARSWQLDRTMPPHAIHGTVLDRAWRVLDDRTISTDLGPDWPFPGRVTQRFAIEPGSLTTTLELEALDGPMPGAVGWHPWFRRRLDGGDRAAAEPIRLELDAAAMLQRDPDGIAGRERIAPPPGPWDDCFTDLRRPPTVTWPGVASLEIRSDCAWWVVFDEQPEAICVEPQTEPPNELNHRPRAVRPGEPLVASMSWHWTLLDGRPVRDPGAGDPDPGG